MWFLLSAGETTEDSILELCKQIRQPQETWKAFVITYDRMRKYQGAWHLEQMKLFPGYVILEVATSQEFTQIVEKMKQSTETVKAESSVLPVHPDAEALLRELSGDTHHLSMSRGVIRDGKTCVLEGPLCGKEPIITRIDRHKRMACLNISNLCETLPVKAGLEITEKTV